MWIAKPIFNLTENEKAAWQQIEFNLPLAQTLNWARAIEAVSGKAFLVFSPDEKVGGVVFSSPNHSHFKSKLQFECINGPWLHWDEPNSIPRQLATFATAVSKINSNFESLSLKPRWERGQMQRRLSLLPIPTFNHTQAATWIVPVKTSPLEQFQSLSHRMQRTLSLAKRNQVLTQWDVLTPTQLNHFVPAMRHFGETHGFTVPPLSWFQALIQESAPSTSHSPSFWLISARKEGHNQLESFTQIIVCKRGNRAHYLFGYETRVPELRSAISTSAVAHWEALIQCISFGVQEYDLNGYLIKRDPHHPYTGVCNFKEQFSGAVIEYDVPEFLIQ